MINRDKRGHSYCGVRVRGAKTIRYRRSSDHKLCHLAIRRSCFDDSAGGLRETKGFGFRGSMVAKLKLKGIDGRAPPGVEPAA
ncbi:hypothetical protein Btru_066316 [Bulinus truncatus]|nr:hypothetical protein Btru_066316 [Bulinus truncatus]